MTTTPATPVADPAAPAAETTIATGGAPAAPVEGKPATTPPAKPDEATPPATTGAPEAYQPFTLPEGLTESPMLKEQFPALARELNLSQEHAQKLVDLAGQHIAGLMAEQQQAWEQQTVQWVDQVKQDKDLGGANFAKTTSLCEKAIAQFGTDGLKRVLEDTGMGNHPEIVRFVAAVGRALAEETPPSGGGPSGPVSDEAKYAAIYDKTPSMAPKT